ncbi:Hypothetical protein POVR1_LOCUS553 [uncultured virus]|nr:Hypothetical protein POVR1_LOCUS553 [uncultured virus]
MGNDSSCEIEYKSTKRMDNDPSCEIEYKSIEKKGKNKLIIENMTDQTHLVSSDGSSETINPTSKIELEYDAEILLDGLSIFSYMKVCELGFRSRFLVDKVCCILKATNHLEIYTSLVIENQSSDSVTIASYNLVTIGSYRGRSGHGNDSLLNSGDQLTVPYEEYTHFICNSEITADKFLHTRGKIQWWSCRDSESREWVVINDNPIAKNEIVNKSSRNVSIIYQSHSTVVLPQSYYQCDEVKDLSTPLGRKLEYRATNDGDVIVLDDLKFTIQQVNPTTRKATIEDVIGG